MKFRDGLLELALRYLHCRELVRQRDQGRRPRKDDERTTTPTRTKLSWLMFSAASLPMLFSNLVFDGWFE